MEIINCKSFLTEGIKITFIACEISVLISYLVITSIYQIIIQTLNNNNSGLNEKVAIININNKLRQLRSFSVVTGVSILISTWASCYNSYIGDLMSLIGFAIIIIFYTYLTFFVFSKILNNKE